MKILDIKDEILKEDINNLISDQTTFEKLRGSTILVTGATGLIGHQLVLTLVSANIFYDLDIKVVCLIRNIKKASSLFADIIEYNCLTFLEYEITEDFNLERNIDYIIHTACETDSKRFITHPVETISGIVNGTNNILQLGYKNKIKGMLYLSSLEVYGIPDSQKKSINETDYGYMDNLVVRSSYSESKKLAETLCISYAKEYSLPVKIARLSQTFGAGVSYEDNRVYAQFAKSVIEKKDIILHTEGNTYRSYCYTSDALSAMLHILLYGQSGEAYNVTNPNSAISIRKMAEFVATVISKNQISVKYDLNCIEHGYNPEVKIVLSTEKISKLGWKAEVDLENMFIRMIQSMKNSYW